MDLFGGASLVTVMLLLAFNQVLIKHTNEGLQPAFAAGLRSAMAALCVGLWMWLRGRPPGLQTAAGVPPMCDEPADFKTFRIALFGPDKLADVAGTVVRWRVWKRPRISCP